MKIITGWDKFPKEFQTFNDTFNQAFDSIIKSPVQNFDFMRTDIKENEDSFIFDIDLPGYKKENISVTFEDGYLLVEAKKPEMSDEDRKGYVRMERSSKCDRSYYVGEIDEENIKAKYENGVLTLNLPKKVDKAPKTHVINID